MKKATVLKPFTTSNNEICLAGDVVYLEDGKVFFNRKFLGRHEIKEGFLDKYFKIEKGWE